MKKYIILILCLFICYPCYAVTQIPNQKLSTGDSPTFDTVALTIDLDTTSSPLKAGIIGIDSSFDVYVSTGTGVSAWIKIGGQ